MLDFAFGFWKTKLKREIVKSKKQKFEIATAKRRSRNHFSILRFNLFRFSALAYSRFFFLFFICIFAGRRVVVWSRRWTLKSRWRHRCGFDPHVRVKAPSLAHCFADFSAWNIGTPPHKTPILWTTENRVRSKYRGMIFCMIVNHWKKVLLNSFLSFKGHGLKLRVFHGTIILVTQQILYILTLFCNRGVLIDSFHLHVI